MGYDGIYEMIYSGTLRDIAGYIIYNEIYRDIAGYIYRYIARYSDTGGIS